jgi:hypothetical protein
VKCKKLKCGDKVHKIGLCKNHFYSRANTYKYIGHKQTLEATDMKERVCLNCDRRFESYGNRRCEQCNSIGSSSHYEGTVSNYIGSY